MLGQAAACEKQSWHSKHGRLQGCPSLIIGSLVRADPDCSHQRDQRLVKRSTVLELWRDGDSATAPTVEGSYAPCRPAVTKG